MNTLDELKKAEKIGAKLIVLPVEQVQWLVWMARTAAKMSPLRDEAIEQVERTLAADWNEPEK